MQSPSYRISSVFNPPVVTNGMLAENRRGLILAVKVATNEDVSLLTNDAEQ